VLYERLQAYHPLNMGFWVPCIHLCHNGDRRFGTGDERIETRPQRPCDVNKPVHV